MKPFLLLATRDHDQAARAEYASVLRHTALTEDQLRWVRVESGPMPAITLDDYAGVFLGGSAFSTTEENKSEVQQRVETELAVLVDEIVDRDLPFMGMCYGVGMVTQHIGGVVDRTYSEPVGATSITLTEEGLADRLLAGIPETFEAFVGHKEACNGRPPGATILATGTACPIQMYRVGENVYVTQFHPELDVEKLAERIRIYRHAGYFEPDEVDTLIAMARASGVTDVPHRIMANFVEAYSV